jgi:hypothetical protein
VTPCLILKVTVHSSTEETDKIFWIAFKWCKSPIRLCYWHKWESCQCWFHIRHKTVTLSLCESIVASPGLSWRISQDGHFISYCLWIAWTTLPDTGFGRLLSSTS